MPMLLGSMLRLTWVALSIHLQSCSIEIQNYGYLIITFIGKYVLSEVFKEFHKINIFDVKVSNKFLNIFIAFWICRMILMAEATFKKVCDKFNVFGHQFRVCENQWFYMPLAIILFTPKETFGFFFVNMRNWGYCIAWIDIIISLFFFKIGMG